MGLFTRYRTPQWVRMMPVPLHPTREQIGKLEQIRRRAGIPHEAFEMHITGHPRTTVRLIEQQCEYLRLQNHGESIQDIFATILLGRVAGGERAFGISLALGSDSAFNQAKMCVSDMHSSKEFAEWVAHEESMHGIAIPTNPQYQWVADAVDSILAEKSSDNK